MRRRWVVIGLAALAVVLGILTNLADARLLPYGPTSSTAAIGEDAGAYPFTVHVSDVQAAHTVVQCCLFETPPPTETDGVWVVVTLSYATADRPRSAGGTGLVLRSGDGREFPVSNRMGSGGWLAGPDIWVRGELVFEVAPDALADLTLVFDPGIQIYGPMPTQYARIPLDLDPDGVLEVIELSEQEILAAGER
jgi:hypothetical protein